MHEVKGIADKRGTALHDHVIIGRKAPVAILPVAGGRPV